MALLSDGTDVEALPPPRTPDGSATGAVMAHGPTVARKYGIPAVICVPGATERIRTGQTVTVDGAAGTATVEESADQSMS